ncbi:hypothetical protein [Saccharothrix sp. ST-888]|uniref:hypothetical protein n=1 Tax=Saccharothrix sp. ST-888 TaxID=1427391 RepID=UPI0005EC150F|nr:hypothetical protein [Saccharothrix sp. ST-888]KJK56118.1 hypothetical protein UK12_24575 [Saccharothrix sp. ST-888]
MAVEASIETGYLLIDTTAWIEDRCTPAEKLNELFAEWEESDAVKYPYGPVQFLEWLVTQPNKDNDNRLYQVEAPHWIGGGVEALRMDNTANEENPLYDDFSYLLFKLDGTSMVALMEGTSVRNPEFHELTCDEMENFFSWNHMWIVCEANQPACVGQHPFETEDGTRWRYYEEGVRPVGDPFSLDEIQNDQGQTICPRCGSEIKKAGAY